MRKFLVCAICAIMCSCTESFVLDIEDEKVLQTESSGANSATFDDMEEKYEILMTVCEDIITVHKDIEVMREALPESLLKKIDSNTYTVFDAVEIIYIWWKNYETYDLMAEWPTWDDFRPALAEIPELAEKYNFRRR